MTLQLYKIRTKEIITIENVTRATVYFRGKNQSKRLKVFHKGGNSIYQADLYKYRWI